MHRDMDRNEFLFWKLLESEQHFSELTPEGLCYTGIGAKVLPKELYACCYISGRGIKTELFTITDDLVATRFDAWGEFDFDGLLLWLVKEGEWSGGIIDRNN